MLTIIKYEIIRQRLSKWLMLGLLGALEVLFLIFLWLDKSEALGYTIAGLSFLAISEWALRLNLPGDVPSFPDALSSMPLQLF